MQADNLYPIGNDIVDLKVIEPALHIRYKSYVFTREERQEIGDDPTRLWIHWAAKEAAYKAIKQIDNNTIFTPKYFHYSIRDNAILYGDYKIYCRSRITPEFVHMSCTTNSAALWSKNSYQWIQRMDITTGEKTKVPPSSSELVRKLAISNISRILKIESYRLSIYKIKEDAIANGSAKNNWDSPPFLLIDGSLSRHALSLSHHGRYIAASFLIQEKSQKLKLSSCALSKVKYQQRRYELNT